MNKAHLLALCLFFTTQSFGQKHNKQVKQDSVTRRDSNYVEPEDNFSISLIKLIATPEKYEGKTIQVVGYLNLEFEGDAIYLHKEDYDHAILHNAFWVDFSKDIQNKIPSKYSKSYVIIIGTFTTKTHGHMGAFGGTIKNITRLDSWNFGR